MSTVSVNDPTIFPCSFTAQQVTPLAFGPWRNVTNQPGCCRTFVGDALLVAYGVDTPSCNVTLYGTTTYKLTVTSLDSGSLGLTNTSCTAIGNGAQNSGSLLNIVRGSKGTQDSYGPVQSLSNLKCDGKSIALPSSGSGSSSSTATLNSSSTSASATPTTTSTAPATTSAAASATTSTANPTSSTAGSGAEKSLNLASRCIWTLAILGLMGGLL